MQRYFESKDYKVLGSVSKESSANSSKKILIKLNEEFDNTFFNNIDILIHCAFDSKQNAYLKNVNGTKKIAELAQKSGVKRQIFVSSYSAYESALSDYGKAKFELEFFFKEISQTIIRPGLVIGRGGLFERIAGVIKNFPLVPMIGGGKVPFPVITMIDLSECINQIITKNVLGKEFNLFYPDFTDLKAIITIVSKLENRKCISIPIPIGVLVPILWLTEKFKIKLPINLENLKGYSNNYKSPHRSDLDLFSLEKDDLFSKVKSQYTLIN